MTVLVVEDQSNLSEPLQDQLEENGHSCLTALDLDETDWTLQNVDVDVLVLDLDIPMCKPLDWLEGMGLARPKLASATVAITGRTLSTDEILKIKAFGASLLQKPFPIQDLHTAVLMRLRSVNGRDEEPDDGSPPSPLIHPARHDLDEH
jgi:DNA-binding response OmpR family regulator